MGGELSALQIKWPHLVVLGGVVCTLSVVWAASPPLVCSRTIWKAWASEERVFENEGYLPEGGDKSLRSSCAHRDYLPQISFRVMLPSLVSGMFQAKKGLGGALRCSKTSPLPLTFSPSKTQCFLSVTAVAYICTPGRVTANVKLLVAGGTKMRARGHCFGFEWPHLKAVADPARRGVAILALPSG